MTTFRTLATVRHHGMELKDYEFTVPLDHDDPSGEALAIFARAVSKIDKSDATLPWLVFLQGGPGDTIEWGARMAAGVMVIVPSLVFFLVSSGRISRGLAAGAVKG